MKNAIIILLAFLALNIHAQDHYLGLQTGMNISNVDQRLMNSDPLVGFSGGLTYKTIISNNFMIGADVLYAQRGFKQDVNLGLPGLTIPGLDFLGIPFQGIEIPGFDTGLTLRDVQNRSEYVTIPVKMGFVGGNKLKGYGQLGVAPSFLVSSTVRIPVILINDIELDVSNYVNKTEWAGLAEAGIIYDMSDLSAIQFGVNYQQSFTPYYTGLLETFSGSKANNVNFSIGLTKKF